MRLLNINPAVFQMAGRHYGCAPALRLLDQHAVSGWQIETVCLSRARPSGDSRGASRGRGRLRVDCGAVHAPGPGRSGAAALRIELQIPLRALGCGSGARASGAAPLQATPPAAHP